MRATKMTSSHCRSATPPLSRASSSDLVCPMSPDLSRHRTLSPDLRLDFARHRPLSPDVLHRYRPLSPDLPRRSRSPGRPRSLMESLLVAKMEALSTGKLVRTDSMDSCSSFGSMSSLPSDVCRCDDCLLGIVDFYMPSPDDTSKVTKKLKMVGHGSMAACRICLNFEASIPIFEAKENEDPNVHSKLSQCLNEQIADIPGYPRSICKVCHITLNTVCNFIEIYKQSSHLLQIGSQVEVKQEIEEINDYCCDVQLEIENENDSLKREPTLDDTKPFVNLLKPLKVKKKIKKEPKAKNNNESPKKYKNKILNKTNKIASSVLEGDFVWTGEQWCLMSSNSPVPAVKKEVKIKHRKKNISQRDGIWMAKEKENLRKLCDHCGLIFSNSDQLTIHMRKQHIARVSAKCSLCPRECVSQYYLERHVKRVHLINAKNFVCFACGKVFAYNGELATHYKRVHENIKGPKKRYPCKYCEKTFTTAKCGLMHERSVHTGERPAVCSVCGSGFTHEDYLKEHMRLHTGERPFKCPVCGRGYAQRGNMKSHIRHNHKISQLDELTLQSIKPIYVRLMRP